MVNTNMYVEAFHRVLKHVYLQGKMNKRIDKCVHTLLKITRDKTIERLIKLTKGKCTSKLTEINKRHNTSLKMMADAVTQTGLNNWKVISTNGQKFYTYISP